jgi:mannose-6-phosphate isomerase-like protein (cupin superfamily)
MSSDVIDALQAAMAQMPQAEFDTEHYFADGMYARVLPRQAGTLIVGKVHKREHFYIVSKGRVAVYMDNEARIYEAGAVIVSQPGTKRAVLALEDSVCMTVHRTNKRNLEKIERELIEPDKNALYDAHNKVKELPCPG